LVDFDLVWLDLVGLVWLVRFANLKKNSRNLSNQYFKSLQMLNSFQFGLSEYGLVGLVWLIWFGRFGLFGFDKLIGLIEYI